MADFKEHASEVLASLSLLLRDSLKGQDLTSEGHQLCRSSISFHLHFLRIYSTACKRRKGSASGNTERKGHTEKKGEDRIKESVEMSAQEPMTAIILEGIRQSYMQDEDDELSDVTFIVGHGKFLYRDELADGKKGTAADYLELLYPANKYLVPALSRLCVQELRDKIQSDNVFRVCETALLYSDEELKNWCLQYINKMSSKIMEMPQLLNLEQSMLSVFLESDGLAASEQEIHRAALRWVEAKVRRDGEAKCPESIRNALGDLIYLIRLPTMSTMEFSQEERVSVLRRKEIFEIYKPIRCKDTSTGSQFGTKKRRLDCKFYLCCPNDYLKPQAVMHVSQQPFRHIRFKLRTDKRIFLKGVSVSSILYPCHFQHPLLNFQIGLSVQVGDLPSVRTLSQVYSGVVEPDIKKSRKWSRGTPTSCPTRAIVLDELCEVPANCVAAVCVQVIKAVIHRTNLKTDFDTMELHLRKEVQLDCLEDERKVLYEFFSSSDDVIVHTMSGPPDILFSL